MQKCRRVDDPRSLLKDDVELRYELNWQVKSRPIVELLCIHTFNMPIRIPTWALALIGVLVLFLGARSLGGSQKAVEVKPPPSSSHGELTFRQRLVAIGDLHGGKEGGDSTGWS